VTALLVYGGQKGEASWGPATQQPTAFRWGNGQLSVLQGACVNNWEVKTEPHLWTSLPLGKLWENAWFWVKSGVTIQNQGQAQSYSSRRSDVQLRAQSNGGIQSLFTLLWTGNAHRQKGTVLARCHKVASSCKVSLKSQVPGVCIYQNNW